jgi:hypothetical protein
VRQRWLWTVAAIFVLVSGACSKSSTAVRGSATTTSESVVGPERTTPTVVLFGDSLAVEAAPDLDHLLEAAGAKVMNYVYGGTAICAWIPTINQVTRTRPTVAVLEFVGTTFSTCMQRYQYESASALAKYSTDMEHALTAFFAVDTHVFLVGTPISYRQWARHDPHWDDLNHAFQALAMQHPRRVTYVDAGAAVEGPGQAFTWTLPCLPSEPCTGPIVNGVQDNVVRAPDGIHICSSNASQLGCEGYSSGAYRFASAMAKPVLRFLNLASSSHNS